MTTGVPENIDQEFTGAVCDDRLAGEPRLTLDKDADSDDAPDFRKPSLKLSGKHCQAVQGTSSGSQGSLLHIDHVGNPAPGDKLAVDEWNLTADEDEVSRSNGRDVCSHRCWSLGKHQAEFGQSLFWSHEGEDSPLQGASRSHQPAGSRTWWESPE
jgi:hypothetical protein